MPHPPGYWVRNEAGARVLRREAVYLVVCDTTGTLDASAAIQAQVDKAAAAGGGRVILPPGIILVNGTVTVPSGVTVEGQGWEDFSGPFLTHTLPGTRGTYILTTTPVNSPFSTATNATRVVFRDFAFLQQHAPDAIGWAPTAYPPCIIAPQLDTGTLLVNRILFWGVNQGAQFGSTGKACGRVTVERCAGIGFDYTVCVIKSGDTFRAIGNHFYSGFISDGSTNPHQFAYIQNHARAFVSYRNDNPRYVDNFVYGCHTGYHFDTSADGNTVQAQMINNEADSCVRGIFIAPTSFPFTAAISNFRVQSDWNGVTGVANSVGLFSQSAGALIDVVNFRSGNARANGIRIEGAGADVSICNLSVENWNEDATGWPAVEITDASSSARLSGRFRTIGGGGAPKTTGNVYSVVPNDAGEVVIGSSAADAGKLIAVGKSNAFAGNGTTHVAEFATGTGISTDEKIEVGIVDGSYAWLQASKPGTAARKLKLNPAGGAVTVGESIGSEAAPNVAWGFDGSGQTVPLVNNATYDLAVGSGLISIIDDNAHAAGVVFVRYGGVDIVVNSLNLSTVSGTAGKLNIFYNGAGKYRFENKTGSDCFLYVGMEKVRPSS